MRNQPLLDAIIHRWYPERVPDEFDDVDILRLFRMFDALGIMAVEDLRERQMKGETRDGEITEDVWEQILEHDRLIADRAAGL